MENKKLIERFEAELAKVDRPGVDKLLAYMATLFGQQKS